MSNSAGTPGKGQPWVLHMLAGVAVGLGGGKPVGELTPKVLSMRTQTTTTKPSVCFFV